MPPTALAPARPEKAQEIAGQLGIKRDRHRWDRIRILVLLVCLLSGAVATILSATMFSHLSVNNDETAYLLQAKALAAGHLFPPAVDPAASFTPWLGVVHGDHYVLKYTPVVASFLALSLVLTGGYAAALGGWAAALVAITYLLAKEVTLDRRVALTAAIIAAAAPLMIIQSALALPYLPFLVLIEIALWGLLVGGRSGFLPDHGRSLSGIKPGQQAASDSLLILG